MIFVQEGFANNNALLFNQDFAGEILIDIEYPYKNIVQKSNIYYYYEQNNDRPVMRKLEDVSLNNVVWGEVPEKLEENQIIVSSYSLSYYTEGFFTIDEFMDIVSVNGMNFEKYGNKSEYVTTEIYDDLEIVAVIETSGWKEDYVVVSDSLYEIFMNKISKIQFTDLVFEVPSSTDAAQQLFSKFLADGYDIDSIISVDTMVEDIVNIIGPVLIYVSIFFAVFAFLIVLNFISSSVRSRKKEVGILRSMGARNKDVLKIFGTEIFLMGVIITFITLIFTTMTVNSINSTISGLISLTIFKDLFIFIVCLLFLVVASIIPLVKILKHNPIDAIRKVF